MENLKIINNQINSGSYCLEYPKNINIKKLISNINLKLKRRIKVRFMSNKILKPQKSFFKMLPNWKPTIKVDEKIDLQMPEEIANADWLPIEKMKHFTFTNAAKNICQLLHKEAKVKSGKIDISKMPIGDLFRDSGFAVQDYKLMGGD